MTQPLPADRPTDVQVIDGFLRVTLADGRQIATPLTWYPRLASASPEALRHYELGMVGIHWPDIDEDLSIAGMLKGIKPPAVPDNA
ncbi:MAG: DUF2442 domain-containing protein [Anaerolineae bacterium]|jgi:hypothetical protein|nr:DUF2442 domain-containing protein [Anaerolineae bacterium]